MIKEPIPAWMKMEVLDRDGWECRCCGIGTRRYPDLKVRPDTLSFDHVIPEAHGGLTHASNLQVLCMRCNTHKATATVDLRQAADEWYQLYQEAYEKAPSHPMAGKWPLGQVARWGASKKAPVLWVATMTLLPEVEREPHEYIHWQDNHWRRYNWPMLKREVHRMPFCYSKQLQQTNAPLLRVQVEPDGQSYLRQQRALQASMRKAPG